MLTSGYAALEPTFTTDRPGVGDTAYLVPQGHVQLEAGITVQEDRANAVPEGTGLRGNDGKVKSTMVAVPNNLIRIGVLEVMELRLLGSEYVYQKTRSQNQKDIFNGVSAPILGTKLLLTKADGWIPQTAAFLNFTFPVGSKRLRPTEVTPDFKVAGNHTLSERLSLEWNLGAGWKDGLTEITGFYTTALGLSLTDTLAAFAEVFGNMNGPSTHGFDAGFTYLVLPTVQLDISGGPAMTDAATDWFIAAGVSFRLPQLW